MGKSRQWELLGWIALDAVPCRQESKEDPQGDCLQLHGGGGESPFLFRDQEVGKQGRGDLLGNRDSAARSPSGKTLQRGAGGELVVGREPTLSGQVEQKALNLSLHRDSQVVGEVNRVSASRYFSAVFATMSVGSSGAGGCLSQPQFSSQSRTNCLSKLGGLPPGW